MHTSLRRYLVAQPSIPFHRGPLTGLRIVDMTTSYAGPTAAMYLADLGADVIKVERPGHGDEARMWGPPFVTHASAWFASANRNKRSVVLDIRHNEGLDALYSLIGNSDVFLQNLNPAKLRKLKLHPEVLRTRFPRLIYCAISGFGLDGPDAELPGYDLAAQARSGLMSVTGALGGSPQRVSTALSDIVTGMCAALAVSAAAVRQRTDGVGDTIDVSLLDSDLALMAPRIAAYCAGGTEPVPSGGTDSVLAVYQTFRTEDRDIAIAIGNDSMWTRFCRAIGEPDLGTDQAFGTNADRRRHRGQLTQLIERRLIERPASEWLTILAQSGVPCSLVQFLSEVVADRQVIARSSLMPVPESARQMVSVRSPFRLASIPNPRNDRFPEHGAHTEEVLLESGLSPERVAQLLVSGAVSQLEQKE
ncbi:CaiB/BaiF CoA transferase family protein [Rhodococcus sp. NPDC019609]|uniref:CaiB/BaiF CoA transferase family protein n=1 Tax=unclassified Rhodococcus (in: high G+C Gram-positive bacteria) TaxID=192944 RepID=UPI0037B3467F